MSKSLEELLAELLPKVLPEKPEGAIKGTELIAKLRVADSAVNEYVDSSLRSTFTRLSQRPDSPIARVSQGQGYYLRSRPAAEVESAEETAAGAEKPEAEKAEVGKAEVGEAEAEKAEAEKSPVQAKEPALDAAGRDGQPEEKFRAIYMRYSELTLGTYSMLVEHTKSKKAHGEAGRNVWKFPDVILLSWLVAEEDSDDPAKERFDQAARLLRESLGEPLFRANSVELKDSVSLLDARQSFFQTLSNSRWAHRATLAIGEDVEDKVADELRRLGAAYGIEVVVFRIPAGVLRETLPSASKIREMDAETFQREIVEKYLDRVQRLTSGVERGELDWTYLADVRSLNEDFDFFFKWIAFCLKNSEPHAFDDCLPLLA